MTTRLLSLSLAGILLGACAPERLAEDPSPWFDQGSDLEVQEAVEFTDTNYSFTGATPIADLTDDAAGIGPPFDSFETWFAPEDAPSETDCDDWMVGDELPVEVQGIVTIHPRYYFKTSACRTDVDRGTDEKYYGSYFIQDATGGVFVLGDSKVAHFDMGDRVTLKVRAIKESFGSKMVNAHDVLDVQRGPEPIYYQTVTTELGESHVGSVVRVEGVVATPMTTFGEVYFDADDGTRFKINVDAELSRRGLSWPVGTRIEATGPVIYSFSEYTVVVMRIGQVREF